MVRFAAIDFETANYDAASACAVGVVIVKRGRVSDRIYSLIRPDTSDFRNYRVHGITANDVEDASPFSKVWRDIARRIDGVDFFASHTRFDERVLRACCQAKRVRVPAQPFICTMLLAREFFGIYPTKLPDVCSRLRIGLRHHRADSDANACATIVLKAMANGWRFE